MYLHDGRNEFKISIPQSLNFFLFFFLVELNEPLSQCLALHKISPSKMCHHHNKPQRRKKVYAKTYTTTKHKIK